MRRKEEGSWSIIRLECSHTEDWDILFNFLWYISQVETQIQEQHEELLTILSFGLWFRTIPACGLGSCCPWSSLFAAKGVEDNECVQC